jgi:hypothetical protein
MCYRQPRDTGPAPYEHSPSSGRRTFTQRLDQLDAVAEGIMDEYPPTTIQWLVCGNVDTHLSAMLDERIESLDDEGRMSFPRRAEVLLDAKVQMQSSTSEPDSAALCKVRWLGNFCQTECSRVELAGEIFLSSRHCELDMIKTADLELSLLHDLPQAHADYTLRVSLLFNWFVCRCEVENSKCIDDANVREAGWRIELLLDGVLGLLRDDD